ncbi:hypothetical protein BDN70DRAFT_883627 [Pholiota conissans]|uniref:ER transporter 6TM N-terminal domain-containing protein n=1 Tax=Pholiota conissans TaxID=109636 RepID=A0A9P5YTK1_9AGAR|nr:hypothetical protein BDN70DRAFT_883627 [Pholiota conissans]
MATSREPPAAETVSKPVLNATTAKGDIGAFGWIKPALRSRRTVKTWIRCVVVFAATAVLMVGTKTSNTMGQAAFFSLIVSVMLPPSLAFSLFLVAATTLLIGMLLGWAFGNAAMAASLAARSSSLLAEQQQKLGSMLNPNSTTPLAVQTQEFVFHGMFLDPRSSAVYGAFLFVGAFAMGALRAYLPNLTLLSLFGTIVLDAICTTGPLLPTKNYTLAKIFLIPTSFYVAVALISLVLVFPESLSHVWLTALREDLWAPMLDILRLQSEALRLKPSDHAAWAEITATGITLREDVMSALNDVTAKLKPINLDTSIGRLGPSDLKRISGELKSLAFRAGGLHAFATFVNDLNTAETRELDFVETKSHPGGTETPRALNRFQMLLSKIKERELQHGHDLDSLVPLLQSSSANLRSTTDSAVVCVMDWLQECNSRRLSTLFRKVDKEAIQKRNQRLVDQLKELQDALDEFRTVERVNLIKPYEKFFDPETKQLLKTKDLFASRSLYICFVFIDTLDAFADRLSELLKTLIDIDAQRPKTKIWFPGRIATVKENIVGNDFQDSNSPLGLGTAQDPAAFDGTEGGSGNDSRSTLDDEDGEEWELEKEKEKVAAREAEKATKGLAEAPKKRNPDAFPPKSTFGRGVVKIAPIFRFFKSPQGIFALRNGIVSIALWVPAVCPSSAWFYYDNKGIWALIMAQTGLAMYAGDQIANFIVRFTGTIAGLLIGMVVWYIGAGLGHGNPYGVVVAATVALAPLLLARISAPPAQLPLWIMTSITIVFVAGYSWVNANQFIIANTGVGISIGWKRALLVIIGFTASFIVMFFPNPISSRVLVRKTLAAIAGEVGHIFAGEIEAFLSEEARARAIDDDTTGSAVGEGLVKEKRVRKIGTRVVAVATRLRFISPSLTTAKFEPQIAGTWPHGLYNELFTLQMRMMAALGLITTSFAKLNMKWCSALVHRTPYLNPNFLSDVFMTITILSNSLMDGHQLPAYLPKLRDRLIYHEYHARGRPTNLVLLNSLDLRPGIYRPGDKGSQTDLSSEDREEEIQRAAGPTNFDGSAIGLNLNQLTLDTLLNEQLPAYSTAIVAFSSLISRIDEMAEIVCTLCGEATFQGYESLHQDYLDREERNVGASLGFADH